MKYSKFLMGLCFLMIGAAGPCAAQNYQQLREAILQQQAQTRSEINQIKDRILQYRNRLHKKELRYDEIFNDYQKQKRLLALRKKKISSLQKERLQIGKEIEVTQQKLTLQQQKLKKLIKNYKKTLRYLYKNGQVSQLALILSSASIHQMMIRNYYLKKFEIYRQEQAAAIKQTQKDLKESKVQLDSAAVHNKNVLAQIEVEKKKLAKKTREQAKTVKLLRQDKQQIQNKLTEKQQQEQELNTTLAQLIARENKVRENQKAANKTTPSNAPPVVTAPREPVRRTNYVGKVGYLSDKRLKQIGSKFSALKGELPWPVKSHTISEHFGRHRNPVYGTVTPNLGIEIVTKADAGVHVVQPGYVFGVQPVTGYGDVVFVNHGKFITAYGNLSKVMVRKNTILKKGDLVGYAGDQDSIRGNSVFFMLRDGNRNVNPENWLK